MKKKVLSILLVICMVVGMLPATVFAAGESADEGICPHHPEHTPECGYAPATDGSASCNHTHDETCGYVAGSPCMHELYYCNSQCLVWDCTHRCNDCDGSDLHCPSCGGTGFLHDETCGYGTYIESDSACLHECDMNCMRRECTHVHDANDPFCGYVPDTCNHVHDESCGGKGTEGSPCTYDCVLCDLQELIKQLPDDVNEDNKDAVQEKLDEIEKFVEDNDLSWDDLKNDDTVDTDKVDDIVDKLELLDDDSGEEEPTQKFHIYYDANGGEGTTEDANEYAADATVTVLANSFTREGYTFTGWNTAADGSGTAYAPEATLTLSTDLTLYAQWEEEETEKFTVTYGANGGEGTTEDSTEYEAGETATILDSSFTLDGHTFTGWNTAADGSGTDYAAGDEVAISADLILYAQWEEEGHSHCVCGKTHRPIGSHSAESVQTWQPLTITSGTLTSGSYYLEDNVTITGTIYISGTVNLCLNGNSLIGNGAKIVLNVDSGHTLNITDCVGTGTITGASSGGYDSGVLNAYGNVTLYGGSITSNTATLRGNIYLDDGAVFTMNGGSVQNNSLTGTDGYGGAGVYVRTATFVMNSGVISGNNSGINYGGGIYCSSYAKVYINGGTITGNTSATKGDGIFYSSLQGSDGKLYIGGAPYIADEIYLDNSTSTKYPYITSAIRNQLTLVVASFAEGRVVAEGSGYTLTKTDLTRITLKDASGNSYYCKLVPENNQIVMTATDPGYAVDKYLVIYDGNGGAGSTADSNEYAVGDTATIKENGFTLSGYGFTGWNTKADGTGTSYAPGDEVQITADLILYAQWEADEYTATFQVEGGTAPANQVVSYEGKLTKPADPTVEGKSFKGWLYKFESDADWSTEYWNFDTDVVTENVTLKADFKVAGLEFNYAYDVYRDPDYPEKGKNFELYNFSRPLGANGSGKVDNAGEWVLTPVGLYGEFKNTAAHSYNTSSVVGGTANAYGVAKDSVLIYELTNNGVHYAYGPIVMKDDTKGMVLFIGDNYHGDGAGYLFCQREITEGSIEFKPESDVTDQLGGHTITVAPTTGGTVKVSQPKAPAGTQITITATAADGYVLDSVSVKTAAGADVTVTNGKFTMPEADVVVTVTFAANATYTITVAGTTHGTVVASAVSAAEGAAINLTITPDVGYEVYTISVKTAAGADVTVTGSSFTMPAANVVVTVTFKTEYIQPEYTVVIPENLDVQLNDLVTALGKIKVTITNLDPSNLIKVALDSDCELVHEDDDDKTIPYSVKAGNEEFTFATYEQTGETELSIHITQEDWDKAFSGKYTDTINFVISVITKN